MIHPGWTPDGRVHRREAAPPFVERYDYACLIFFVDCAIHDFIDRLARGKLALEGVWHRDLAAPRHTSVDRWWLTQHVIFDLETGALHEHTRNGPKHGERRFLDVRVYPRGPGEGEEEATIEKTLKTHAARAQKIRECKEWLKSFAEEGPPTKSKSKYRDEARKKFKGLSARGFDTAWSMAVGDNLKWITAGRKSRTNKA